MKPPTSESRTRESCFLAVLLVALLAGCATSKPTGHLRVEGEERIREVHAAARLTPVHVSPEEFSQAMEGLVLDLPLHSASMVHLGTRLPVACAQPLPAMHRRLAGLTLAAWPPASAPRLTQDYARWCERTRGPGDCLSLLGGRLELDEEGRQRLALSLAFGSVWEETKGALGAMANPMAVQATLVSAMTLYPLGASRRGGFMQSSG